MKNCKARETDKFKIKKKKKRKIMQQKNLVVLNSCTSVFSVPNQKFIPERFFFFSFSNRLCTERILARDERKISDSRLAEFGRQSFVSVSSNVTFDLFNLTIS